METRKLEDIYVTPTNSRLEDVLSGSYDKTYFMTIGVGVASPLIGLRVDGGIYIAYGPLGVESGLLISSGYATGFDFGTDAMFGMVYGPPSTLDGNFYTATVNIGGLQASTLYGDGNGNSKVHVGYAVGMGVGFGPLPAGSSVSWTYGGHASFMDIYNFLDTKALNVLNYIRDNH